MSFSLSAVAKLGVPPGKWFCLGRTGLGYSEYSCCVCGAHHDAFMENWEQTESVSDWKWRIEDSVIKTLHDMHYRQADIEFIKARICDLVFTADNYIVNTSFMAAVNDPNNLHRIRIITDGPRCLPAMLFPSLPPDSVKTGKSNLSGSQLKSLSEVHVGTNLSDLSLPQTTMLVNRKLNPSDVPSQIRVVNRLTPELFNDIFRS